MALPKLQNETIATLFISVWFTHCSSNRSKQRAISHAFLMDKQRQSPTGVKTG